MEAAAEVLLLDVAIVVYRCCNNVLDMLHSVVFMM
jgi:hypothetical protein